VLHAELIDPRDATSEVDEPTYRVQFWKRTDAEASYRVRGAGDVLEVLAWAERQQREQLVGLGDGRFPADRFLVFAEAEDELNPPGLELIRVFGRDPMREADGGAQ
jgi:hypothetical protein